VPLTIPTLDNRGYQELLEEALARIPVYTPEWTNFNESDPGVTIIELFAFLTESLLYRANQIPERNRRRFLKLLGIPLKASSSAVGIVAFTNESDKTFPLRRGVEVRAGAVPFVTQAGLDVLPIEGRLYYKRLVSNPSNRVKEYYNQLYASYAGARLSEAELARFSYYESVPFDPRVGQTLDLKDTADLSLWLALLATKAGQDDYLVKVRDEIGGKTICLGLVPAVAEAGRRLAPGGRTNQEGLDVLTYRIPVPGRLSGDRKPSYRTLVADYTVDILSEPGVVQITLPKGDELKLWDNLEPLEAGVGEFPPSLLDEADEDRLLTWLRIQAPGATDAKILWAGINATLVKQLGHVSGEVLPQGSGQPDQTARLSRTPVIPESVELLVDHNSKITRWKLIDDLTNAGPEVPVPDPKDPPGTPYKSKSKVEVFAVTAESGEIRFGDGIRGKRPPAGAKLRVSYDYGVGREGNVRAGSISSGPSLPEGVTVTNPVATWGGAEAETVSEGERQIAAYLRHRDRLVNEEDFRTITLRTPGVDIGRVEVLSAFSPLLPSNQPGDAPGVVTLMIVPKYDPKRPQTPEPSQEFLDAICAYLDPRRLVTTEIYLRGPTYVDIWVSVGFSVSAGATVSEVREDIRRALLKFLSPLPQTDESLPGIRNEKGWLLRKDVVALELAAIANRVAGVLMVDDVKLARGSAEASTSVQMKGLELPRVAGLAATVGEALDLDSLRPALAAAPAGDQQVATLPKTGFVPVPVVPEECR